MRNALIVIGLLCLAGALISGILGFWLYPAKQRGIKKRDASQEEGLSRVLFIIFAAGAFVALFFGLLTPG